MKSTPPQPTGVTAAINRRTRGFCVPWLLGMSRERQRRSIDTTDVPGGPASLQNAFRDALSSRGPKDKTLENSRRSVVLSIVVLRRQMLSMYGVWISSVSTFQPTLLAIECLAHPNDFDSLLVREPSSFASGSCTLTSRDAPQPIFISKWRATSVVGLDPEPTVMV